MEENCWVGQSSQRVVAPREGECDDWSTDFSNCTCCLTVWKDHLCFKQDICLKAAKFGIKSYELLYVNSVHDVSGPSLFTQGMTWNHRISVQMQRQITLQRTWLASDQMWNTVALSSCCSLSHHQVYQFISISSLLMQIHWLQFAFFAC